MTSLIALLSTLSLFTSSPVSNFDVVKQHSSNEEIVQIENNNINDWISYYNYLESNEQNNLKLQKGKGNEGNDNDVSNGIVDVKSFLNQNYQDYYWIRDEKNSSLTSSVSNYIPVEMNGNSFPREDIEAAIKIANVSNYTSYGGCGPIASMGILDYFARYLGYDEIIKDPTNSYQRQILAASVLSRTKFSIFGNEDNTLVWPWDNSRAFNEFIESCGLKDIINAKDYWTLSGGEKDNYWDKIVTSINNGIPVTLFTGLVSGSGYFSEHYTNIYGYDTWVGYPNNGGDRITKKFIKARLNFGFTNEYYCDADILNCGQTGIITYDVKYSNDYSFYASDFSSKFVNSSGGGQYFFNEVNAEVTLTNNIKLDTKRLRTSYIENQYLVLSPNRKNAGVAYLDITFPHSVPCLSFSASMWGGLEGQINEKFTIQYMTSSGWKNHITIDPYELSRLKAYPDSFNILLPKNTHRIRFYSQIDNPTITTNRGRIVLDNFVVNYN